MISQGKEDPDKELMSHVKRPDKLSNILYLPQDKRKGPEAEREVDKYGKILA